MAQWPQVMVYDDGMVTGYLCYNLSTNETGKRVLKIHEFFASEDEAYRGCTPFWLARTTSM